MRRGRVFKSYLTSTAACGAVLMALGVHAAPAAAAPALLPTGGKVTAGTASIAASAPTTLTINQSSSKAILSWTGFSIGQGDTVQFNNGSGSTLNRVTGLTPSQIDGLLSGTGDVYLINPNGVVIGKTGVVNTGGTFVASTLDIADSAYQAGGNLTFSGASKSAVINYGKVGSLGGDVVLIASTVNNAGQITAPTGDIGLLGGSTVTLYDSTLNSGKFAVQVGGADDSVTNSGLIEGAEAELRTNGGNIYALAGNTDSIIKATGVSSDDGKVFLVAQGGTLDVAGTVSAVGANGAGGYVETSGETVNLGAADITTGEGGQWLLDPTTLTIDTTLASTIDTSLSKGTSVTESAGSSTTPGSLTVAAPIAWSTTASLTLTSIGTLAINAPITISGPGALNLNYTTALTFAQGADVNFSGGKAAGGSLAINATPYTLLYSISDLQGVDSASVNAAGDGGTYALATPLAPTTAYTGALIGAGGHTFSGTFEGLGNTLTGLTINDTANAHVGLFGQSTGVIRDLGLVGGSVTGAGSDVGGLVGLQNGGTITNIYATGAVVGSGSSGNVGDLVGQQVAGTIANVYATGSVAATGPSSNAGGLVGEQYASGASTPMITNVYATGAVSGTGYVGGLVGAQTGTTTNVGTIQNVYATGAVSASGSGVAGGLAGEAGFIFPPIAYDSSTTGVSGGSTTTVLQSAAEATTLGTAFAGKAGVYPYLASFFPSGVQAVSGIAYKDDGLTLAASGATGAVPVSVSVNGQAEGSATTGANGYYYIALPASTIPTTSASLVAYTPANTATGAANAATFITATGTTATGAVSGLNLFGGYATLDTTLTTYSAASAALTTAEAANGVPGFVPSLNPGFLATGTSFTVDQAVTVPSGGALLLDAPKGALAIDAPISVAGTGAVNLDYSTSLSFGLTASGFSGSIAYGGAGGGALSINTTPYTLLYSISALQGVDAAGDGGYYALAAPLTAPTTAYSSALIGAPGHTFSGTFEGLGNTLTGLTINDTANTYVGLFGQSTGAIRDLGLVGGSVTGAGTDVGGLVGYESGGSILNAYVAGAVAGTGLATNAGDLVGYEKTGSITNAFTTGTTTTNVSGLGASGGLVGYQYSGTIKTAFANGAVAGGVGADVGGLVGYQKAGTIEYAYATGAVYGGVGVSGNPGVGVGGLVGYEAGTITDAYATGAVTGPGVNVGGLVGDHATGAITGGFYDQSTTGVTTGGGIGLTTSTFQAMTASTPNTLGSAFGYGPGAGSTLYPYLTSFFPTGVQAVSGIAYADAAGATPAASGKNGAVTVGLSVGGAAGLGDTATTGANGYYYIATPTGTINATTGSSLLAYTTANAATGVANAATFATAATSGQSGFNLYGQTLTETADASISSLAALQTAYTAAALTTPLARATLANLSITANTAATFAVDQQIYTGALTLSAPNGAITESSAGGIIASSLTGSAGAVSLTSANNALQTLGPYSTTTGALSLADSVNLTVTGAVIGATGVTVQTLNGLTLAPAAGVTATTGNVVLAAGAAFTNNAGSTAVLAPSGAWDIYSATPTGDTFGGLASGNAAVWDTAAGAAITQSGDRYVFAFQPTLTFTTVNDSQTYGAATTANGGIATDYTVSGYYTGNGAGTAFTADTASTVYSRAPTITSPGAAPLSNVGYYAITADTSTLTSLTGYRLTSSNVGQLQITPEAITLNAVGGSKVYDGNTSSSLTPTVTTGMIYPGDATVSQTYNSADVDTANNLTPAATFAGIKAIDYLVSTVTAAGTITPYTLTAALTGSVTKTYDSGNSATLTSANYTLTPALGSDPVSLVPQTSGTYGSVDATTGIPVTVSGLTLASNAHGDYQLASTSLTANIGQITPEAITLTAVSDTKVYDGNTSSQVAPTVTGTIYNTDLTPSQTYNSADVDTAKFLTPAPNFANGKSIDYTVSTVTAQGTITPYTLTASLIGPVTKAYDSTNSATLTGANYTLTSALGSDPVSLVPQTSGTYGSVDVATSIPVTVSGLTLASNAHGDYQLASTSLTANIGQITPEAITLTAVSDTKVYDGNTSSQVAPTVTGTIYNTDLTPSQTYNSADVDTAKFLTPAPNFANGKSIDYTVSTVTAQGTITPYTLTASLIGPVTKAYDSTNSATLTGANYTLTSALGSDPVSLVPQTSGTYGSVDVATSIPVTVSGLTLASNAHGDYQLASTSLTANIGQITPAPLTITATDQSSTYGTAYTLGAGDVNFTSTSLQGHDKITSVTEDITVNGVAVTGTQTKTSAGEYEITASAPQGIDTADYSITYKPGVLTVAQLAISLTGTLTYDDSTTAQASSLALHGVLPGDTVSLGSTGTATLAGKDVVSGGEPIVSESGLSLTGAQAGDYSLNLASLGAVTVTPEPITVAATGGSMVYDQSAASNLKPTVTAGTLYTGDATLSQSYNTADVTTAKTLTPFVTYASAPDTASGTTSNDYTVKLVTAAGTITPDPITATLVGTVSKVYDSTVSATVVAGNISLAGVYASDSAYVSATPPTVGEYANANVGSAILVGATGFSLTGTKAQDYTLTSAFAFGNVGTITPEPITITATSGSKTYNGSTASSLTPKVTSGTLYSGAATLSESYASPNASTADSLIPSESFATTTLAGDYSVTNVSASGTITPAPLTATLTGTTSKVYNGTSAAALSPANYVLSGFVLGQGASVTQTAATYANDNVGSGISVTALLSSSVLSPTTTATLLSNYSVPASASGAIGVITPAPLTASLTGVVTKVYNGTLTASVPAGDVSLSGLVSGDSVGVTAPTNAQYASDNVGSGLQIGATGFTLTGTKASDYSLVSAFAFGNIGTITPATLGVSLTGTVSKVYDGTTAATLTPANYSLTGIIGNDQVYVTTTQGTYATKNVGSSIPVKVTGLTLGGAQLGDYKLNFTSLTSPIGTITPDILTATPLTLVSEELQLAADNAAAPGDYGLSETVLGLTIPISSPPVLPYNPLTTPLE